MSGIVLAVLTAVLVAFATGLGGYLWETSDRLTSRLAIGAVALAVLLLFLGNQGSRHDAGVVTGSLGLQHEHSSIATRRVPRKAPESPTLFDGWFRK